MTKYLQKLTEDPKINLTYASIATSIVIEAVLHGPLPSIDYRNRHATLFDGGDVPISMTPAPLVGEAVAAVLKNPELTENKTILVHGGAFTLRQVLTIAQKYVGKDNWKVDHQDTSKMEAESYEALSKTPEDALRWLPGLIRRCLFGEGFGGDFTGRTANEALGLKTLSEEDLDRYIENVIAADQKQ